MKCPFCQNDMKDARTACPACKRPYSHHVAYQLALAWNSMKLGDQSTARTAFNEALRVTPVNDRKQLESYITFLVEQSEASSPATKIASVMAAAAASTGAVSQPYRPEYATPSSATVSAPAPRLPSQPQTGKARRALLLNFNEKPANIVRVMDETRQKQSEFAKERTRRLWIIALLLPLGLPFVCADVAMGYNMCTFSLVGLALWVAALVGFITLMRNRPSGKEFGPQYDIARTIFETLRDDIAPKRTLIGWLDLSGTQQTGKVVRQQTSSSGMPVAFYRDEWLRMKMPLYDGNVMRLAVVERVKARLGKWKVGRISHKRKWKAGSTVWGRRELKLALTINPEAYELLPIQNEQVGKFALDATQTGSGRIVLSGATNEAIGAGDILQVLRFAYEHLKPRGEAVQS
ncbi:MAG: hypothetical protein JW850_21150 [Thermoflexales bacterium]|nr:hypothetical protein [Thermoflexales bacterium]